MQPFFIYKLLLVHFQKFGLPLYYLPQTFIFVYIKPLIMSNDQNYSIPLRYRKMENLHIVFWLFKDVSWWMLWKALAIAMIVPTLVIAIVIAYRTKEFMSEVCHNLAIIFWISANSLWMITEFLEIDENHLFGSFDYRHLAIIPFVLGLLMLAYYYAWWRPRHKDAIETM